MTLTDALPSGVMVAGPELALHLDEITGATHFEDDSGFGHHGTCSGDACPTAGVGGRYGQAVQFDGSNDYIAAEINVSETAYALSLWFKTSCTDCGIFSVDAGTLGSSGVDRNIHLNGGNLCATIWSYEAKCTSGTDYADDAWHHVVHTFGGSVGGQRIYVDGALQESGDKFTSDFWQQTGVNVGFAIFATNGYLDGFIDEVVIYDRALSDQEIAALYQNSLAWDLGVMPPGAVATVTLPVRVSSAQTRTLTNTTGASGAVPEPDPDDGDNTATETTAVQVQADLALTKAVAPDPALVGIPVTYTIPITNHGPADAHNVLLTDTLQGTLTWGTIATTWGSCGAESGGTFTCTLGTMKGESLAQITLVVTPTAAGTLTNTVRIVGDEFDPNSINNAITRTTGVGEIDLALGKTANGNYLSEGDLVAEGDGITYTIVLTNHGPGAAASVTISDALPGGISFGAYIGTQGTYTSTTGAWDVGALAVGEVATLTITGTVGAGTAGQTLINTAVLSASNPADIVTRNNAASAAITVADANLGVSKTVDNPTPSPGDEITYTLTFSNVGNGTATGVIITDSLPVSVTNTSVSSSGAQITATGAISYVWDVEDLSAGEWGVITITGVLSQGLPASPFTNTATIATASADSDPTNNSGLAGVTVANVAPVLASIGNQAVDEGSLLSFTATASDSNDDPLAFSLLNAPAGAGIDSASGAFSWTPSEAQGPGVYTVTVVVSDTVITDSGSITITVDEVNRAPTISNIPNQHTKAGVAVGPVDFTVGDAETDAASLVLGKASSNTSLLREEDIVFGGSGVSRTLAVAPTAGVTGTATITVTVSDGELEAYDTFILAVSDNAPPELTSTPVEAATVGMPYTYAITAYDADPEDALTFTAPVSATWLTLTQISTRTAMLSGTPTAAGDYPVLLQVTDGVDSATQSFTIGVASASNQPPVADAGAPQTVLVSTTVTLDGSASYGPDGDELIYGWAQTGGPPVSLTPNISVTTFTAPSSATALTFTLTLTDAGGLTDSDTVVITVVTGRNIYLPLVARND